MRKVAGTLLGARVRSGLLASLLTLFACGPLPETDLNTDQAVASPGSDFVPGTRVHKMPLDDGRPTPYSAPAGSHLTYYGGRVISNAQVVEVLYGTGTYASFVSGTGPSTVAGFYGQMTNSAYMDWLTEYNTPASGGTNQAIGRGTFLRQVQITPAAANNGATITDTQIQSEISAQITAGVLPAPATDAAGNVNTLYMVHFPKGKKISQGTSSSCVAGGFCAFHGTFTKGSQHLYYGVMPDMSAGSGCDTGCGTGTAFGNQTSVASHEVIEAITDAEVGLASVVGPPLAWYDSVNGEIGDICNAQQGTIVGTDGVTYVVQKEYSNVANDCIVTRATTSNDFSLAVSPSSQSVAAGSSVSYTVTATLTSGSAQTVSLSVSGLPAGVSGSFNPASVSSSGGTSTLTLTAASSAAATTASFTVTGAGSVTHTATGSVTVTSGGGGGGTLANGDFEAGALTGWTVAGSASVSSSGAHGGTYAGLVGSTSATNGDSSVAQTFTAPTGATGLSFFYKVVCPDSVTYDWATATLKDNTAGTTVTVVAKTCTNSGAWVNATSTLVAGHSYTLSLFSHDDNYASDPTYTLYDDVTISTGGGGGGGSGVTNGTFEAGSLSGWTSAGTASAVSSGAHAGTWAARAGSTAATNGDSSVTQTFTVPAGKTQLSFWYKVTCPDTVTYDWATATLKNNGAGTTATVLAKTCTNSGAWVNVTAAVTAGTSYTLTLSSHDDNYAGDPTYTLYDDVTLN